jgi:hypothetical protein
MKTTLTLGLIALGLAISTCTKEKMIGPARPSTPYFVRMTDAPGPYTAVIVDIQGIEITANGATTSLSTNTGTYNLLNFTNGVDTLIATGDLNAERVQQIRLILGPNNSVVSGGTTYPLEVPSASQSGLKLQVHQTLEAGVAYEVLLDFDANQSIVDEGNGTYKLKPVIRTIETALSGAIKGQITPAGVPAVITATTSSGAYSSAPDASGNYIIKGLPAGTYTLLVFPPAPYNNATVNGIQVTTGVTTTVAAIAL